MCLNYHGHEGIELVSEAEFEANTTEEQRKGPRGSHSYELARLTFEMKKREELVSSLKTHELRRKLYEGKLTLQRKFLDSLQVSLPSLGCQSSPSEPGLFSPDGSAPHPFVSRGMWPRHFCAPAHQPTEHNVRTAPST